MAKNERAFAIHAAPEVIWPILRAEIQEGIEGGRVSVEHEESPRRVAIWVQMGRGLAVRYDYRLSVQPEHTEVAVEVTATGLRHSISSIMSLGRSMTPYLVAVTQGLANLKDEAEREAARQRGSSG